MSTAMPNPIILSLNAAKEVWELIEEEGNLNLNLRVSITGGGCSGFQYGFSFDEKIQPDDTVIERRIPLEDGEEEEGDEGEGGNQTGPLVRLLVDPMSYQYLVGSEIDYKEDIEGSQFIIRNPNAKTTCGCGSSFSA